MDQALEKWCGKNAGAVEELYDSLSSSAGPRRPPPGGAPSPQQLRDRVAQLESRLSTLRDIASYRGLADDLKSFAKAIGGKTEGLGGTEGRLPNASFYMPAPTDVAGGVSGVTGTVHGVFSGLVAGFKDSKAAKKELADTRALEQRGCQLYHDLVIAFCPMVRAVAEGGALGESLHRRGLNELICRETLTAARQWSPIYLQSRNQHLMEGLGRRSRDLRFP